MKSRLEHTILLVVLAALAVLAAWFLFHCLDDVRGYDDIRDDQVSTAYAWIVSIWAVFACFNSGILASAFGFLAGSMVFLVVLSLIVLLWPINPAMAFILMLPVGVGGAVLGWKRARRNQS